MRQPTPDMGKKILFWDEKIDNELGPLLDFLRVVPGGKKYGQPRDHIRHDIPWNDREELARALKLRTEAGAYVGGPGGDVFMGYMGYANCRICGEKLGTRDLFGYGFVWPEKADHYILNHKVWTKECDDLLAAVRRSIRPTP